MPLVATVITMFAIAFGPTTGTVRLPTCPGPCAARSGPAMTGAAAAIPAADAAEAAGAPGTPVETAVEMPVEMPVEPPGAPPAGATTAPASRPAPPPAPPAPAADPVIDLLDALEQSARDLEAFTASIVYQTEDALLGDRVIRFGRMVYRAAPDTGRSFAIAFDAVVENRRRFEQRTLWVYAGGWLAEIDHDNRQFVKRQVVRPGEKFDPLKLGEGPIPIPIGQPRAEVLARFDVTLIDLPADGFLAKLAGGGPLDGLRLVPKPETPEAADYERIDLFYDRATRLPAGVELVERNGDRKSARLEQLVRNPVLGPAELAWLDIEPPAEGWRVDIRPLAR